MRYQALTSALLVTFLAGCMPTQPPAPKTPATPETPEPAAAAPAQPTERVAAEAGVGKKGQSLKDETGMVVEPLKQLIKFEQKAVFDFQIKPALELYRGEHSSYPKDYEEFKKEILDKNGIKLPELPAGQTYVFDAEQGQLMVERPKQ